MHKLFDWLKQKAVDVKPLVKSYWWVPASLFVVGLIVWMIVLRLKGHPWNEGTGFKGKTVWDWMQLLIIPAVLAVGALLFNWSQRNREKELALDRQREEALQTYIDRMTELLLKEGLRKSKEDDEVRDVARTRTLTTLRILDPDRKSLLVRFIQEARLITTLNPVINMSNADLSKVHLSRTDLQQVNLRGANLKEADLEYALLDQSNLNHANLSKADLFGAHLTGANLSSAYLNHALLIGSHLEQANLVEAVLISANLFLALLIGADIRDAILSKANLNLADLSKADLSRAYLNEAILRDADLRGANLREARMEGAMLDGAKLTGTIMPDGTVHE